MENSKTPSPEGITVAADTGGIWRVRAICDPVELVPHTPTLWIDGGIEKGIMTLFRADSYVGPSSHCPVCGAPMRADPDTFYPDFSTVTGWLHGSVNAVCTADPAHDTGDETFPASREYVALISAAVRERAIDIVLTLDMVSTGCDDVMYRTWGDPVVRIGYEAVLPDDAIVLAHIKNGDRDPFYDALDAIRHNAERVTEQLLREEVWEEIIDQLLKEDSPGIAVAKFEEMVGRCDPESVGYCDWIQVLGRPDDAMMARVRAAPAILIGYECRKYARCPECGTRDRPSEFATVDGVDYCRNCGAEFEDTPSAWDDDADDERNLREPVGAPMEDGA